MLYYLQHDPEIKNAQGMRTFLCEELTLIPEET